MKSKVVFGLILTLAATCAGAGDVDVSFLTKGKKVIPLVMEYDVLKISDIKLPDLVVTNRSSEPLTPVGVEVIGKSGGEAVMTLNLGADLVQSLIDGVNPQFKKVAQSPDELMGLSVGELDLDASKLSDGAQIGPGQSAVLLLWPVLHLSYAGVSTVDKLDVVVTLKGQGKPKLVTFPVPLFFPEDTGDYVLPVRGSIFAASMPMNYGQHREALSQEFAIDLLEVHPYKDGDLSTTREFGSGKLTDYFIYRKPVMSIADGEVVEVANAFPEDQTVSTIDWTQEKSLEKLEKLRGKIGVRNAVAGNYVVIKHGEGRYGFYAHLSQDTIRVKAGDKVKAGQEIAQVGSTGNSSEPHLHFHLMDGPDMLKANGLPVMFKDVVAQEMNQNFTSANSLAVSDFLLISNEPEE